MITRIATQAGMATETTRGRGERQRLEWVAAEHVAVALSAPTVFVSAVLSLGEGQGWHISLEGLINRHNAVGGWGDVLRDPKPLDRIHLVYPHRVY